MATKIANPNEVCFLYIRGLSIRQVAEKVGVSFQRVHQILKTMEVVRRPQHYIGTTTINMNSKPIKTLLSEQSRAIQKEIERLKHELTKIDALKKLVVVNNLAIGR